MRKHDKASDVGTPHPPFLLSQESKGDKRGVCLTPKRQTVFIRTFGCQANEADSELVYSMLLAQGYEKAGSYEDADVILFNTCSVRKHAEDRVWGKVGELGKIGTGPIFPIIGIIGCMAKAHGEEIFKRLPHVNFICGPSDIYEVADLIEQSQGNPKKHFVAVSKKTRPIKKGTPHHSLAMRRSKATGAWLRSATGQAVPYREEKIRAFVNISYGCNNFCSYCIVPYVRGREISRKSQDILDEIKSLVDDGVKEITLLGQNVNSFGERTEYRVQRTEFVKLLEKINKIDGLLRIRFMTSHPKDANTELFKAMRDLDKVCEHLHLPLQSGSDKILKLMNRKYTASDYRKLVGQYRKIVKKGSITIDAIVGFPTEAEEDFYKTYILMKEIKFDGAFIFKYSPRPHTTASKLDDDVTKEVKEERNQILLKLQDEITKGINGSLINTNQEVLTISQAKRKPASYNFKDANCYLKGRTRQNKQIIYDGTPELIGELSNVKIKTIEENTLIGEIV